MRELLIRRRSGDLRVPARIMHRGLHARRSVLHRPRAKDFAIHRQPVRREAVTRVSGTGCRLSLRVGPRLNGSRSRTRTYDRAINSRLLYQLSYSGSPWRRRYNSVATKTQMRRLISHQATRHGPRCMSHGADTTPSGLASFGRGPAIQHTKGLRIAAPQTLQNALGGRKASEDRSGCGGIGRRAGLKIRFRKECRFDSDHPHHLTYLRSESMERRRGTRNQWTQA